MSSLAARAIAYARLRLGADFFAGAFLAARLLCCTALAVVAEALLQRRHQVDDVGALARPAVVGVLDDLLALLLLLLGDQFLQRIDIAVVEFLGVEVAALLLDQRRGEIEQIGIGLVIADLAEETGARLTSSA